MVTEKNFWLAYTILVLGILLAFQILWFVATTTLRDYDRLTKEVIEITDNISRINAAAVGTTDGSAKSLIEPLEKHLSVIEPQMTSALSAIKTWNFVWKWMVFWGQAPCIAGAEAECDEGGVEHGEIRSANSATEVLGLYLLPLLYGWLGALLWVVQRSMKASTEAALEKLRPASRVVTGMVAGPLIGMFLSPEFLNSLAFQATPFAFAFAGGYGTDVFFALLDRVLSGVRSALAPKSVDELHAGGKPADGKVRDESKS
jgi:hypothetical protein